MAAEPIDLSGLPMIELTPMRRRHLRAVLRIEAQVYPRPWTLSLFLSELALKTTRAYWVARVEGQVVGYCGLMLSLEDAHITTVAVDPDWQRRRIASRLLLGAAREAVARGCTALTLEVRMSNQAAQRLYHHFGFRPAGVRRNYYAEVNEDALVMWADDIALPEYAARLAEIEQASGDVVVEASE